MSYWVPPGQPTDVTLSRASPAFKAQREFKNQYGTGLPLEQPDMNLAATDAAVLGRQILQRSAKRGRVSGDACFAATAFLQNILERHGIKALNEVLQKLRNGVVLVQDPVLQEKLVALAHRCEVITKLVPYEWFDGYLLVRRDDGTIVYYGLAIQSIQRYSADSPGNHPGGSARQAMLLPRRPAFKLQGSARQLNQPMLLIGRQVLVGSASKVKAQMLERASSAAGASAAAAAAEQDMEEVEVGSNQVLQLLLGAADEADEAEAEAEIVGEEGEEEAEPPQQQQGGGQDEQAAPGSDIGSGGEEIEGEPWMRCPPLCWRAAPTWTTLFKLVVAGDVYQKLLAVDFLFHNSLYSAVEDALLSRWGSGCATQAPLTMLDLGCGDAQQIASTLARCGAPSGALRLASYTGVDVSPPAVAIAQHNLTFLQPACSVAFVQQDMATFVEACPAGQYDLVFASFAVHHLSLEGKASFLRHAARCLRPGGAFVLVDVFLREGEDRTQWLDRFRAYMQEAVDAGVIDAEEAATVMGHIEPFDFPEHVPTYQRMAADAGFAAADCLHTDPKEFSRVMVLRVEQ